MAAVPVLGCHALNSIKIEMFKKKLTYLKTVTLSINILVNGTNIWHQNMTFFFL